MMLKIKQRRGIKYIVIFVAFVGTFLVYLSVSRELSIEEEIGKLYNETSLFCANEFILDVNVKKNENRKYLQECKGIRRRFRSSLKQNMNYISNYIFNISSELMYQLKLDREGIEYLSAKTENATKTPTFVTALSDNHYEEFMGFLRMMSTLKRNNYSDLYLIVYNIGLSVKNKEAIREKCNCSVRNFPFEIFPQHVRHLRGFTWKPIIIQLVLQESDFVMWMDTSIRLKHIDPYFKKAKRYGIQVLHGSGSISVRTHQRLFETLNEKQCMFNYPEIQAGLIIITRSCLTLTYIMRPWVSCALQYGCMDIPNAENYYDCTNEWKLSSCHRSDQSVLGIILTRLFNQRRHQFIIEQDFGNVCRDCP
uniref:Uncharacterized protein LOC111103092 n=1 Tax=Crassostrea virginica TaxID=6565 RepID=A0A8B8AMG2_CRAVI|nr:uncharacterized protein LOC111103092 [Crassostrea virginica]XP_022291818.1 uncharacterized protein LOC111103092 [Crassostrea virginica]XP_022291819.1 uncharacterized protein LOC111103092 [Crassostrea virginica]